MLTTPANPTPHLIPSAARQMLLAYGRALRSQINGKILLLSLLPLVLSLVLWGGLLYAGLQPLIDTIHSLFETYGGFQVSSSVLATFGLGMLKTLIVPLIAMLLLLPLMILTALIFMGLAAMPVIVNHVSKRQFPDLEKKQGGSFVGSLTTNLTGFLIFVPAWLMTLPLYVVPPLAILVQVVLWGWLTARVVAYDALADHASAEERAQIMQQHRLPLLVMGMVSGAFGAIPGVVWIGGTVLSVVLFPFLAAISIWLYVIIFIFTGLWFQYYCMQALLDLRKTQTPLSIDKP